MEFIIGLLIVIIVMGLGSYIHHLFKFRDTPNKIHYCNVPYTMYFHQKEDWRCRKCKAYWYVKYDSYGSYFVKRD